MAADIESETFVPDRPCDSPHVARIGLQNLNRVAIVSKFITGGQARRPGADNNYAPVGVQSQIIFL